MYIRTQDNHKLIKFDNFHEILIDEENKTLFAVCYGSGSKHVVKLGSFKTVEEMKKEYECIEDSFCDDTEIYMVE